MADVITKGNTEFAQSYMHHALMILGLFFSMNEYCRQIKKAPPIGVLNKRWFLIIYDRQQRISHVHQHREVPFLHRSSNPF